MDTPKFTLMGSDRDPKTGQLLPTGRELLSQENQTKRATPKSDFLVRLEAQQAEVKRAAEEAAKRADAEKAEKTRLRRVAYANRRPKKTDVPVDANGDPKDPKIALIGRK